MSTSPEIPPEVPLLRRRGGVREGTVRRLRGASCRNFSYLVPLTALIMELNDKKFAVLVDADNISHRKIKDILDEIANYGTPTIKRIYGDFTNPKFAAWKEVLLENSITPIQQYAYTTGKNATDSALIIDAMDILYTENVTAFCIVTSDSDFTKLAMRLRESGMTVIGMGEQKTPSSLVSACETFKFLDLLYKEDKPAPSQPKREVSNVAEESAAPTARVSTSIPTRKEIEKEIIAIIEARAGDEEWVDLSEIGDNLPKRVPGFDPRNYKCQKLKQLIETFKSLETKSIQNPHNKILKIVYVKVR